MKKLLLLCSLFVATGAFAQDYYGLQEYGLRANTTRVELYGGMSQPQSTWTHDGHDMDLGDTGFSAGLAFVRNITPAFSLGVDGNYSGFSSGDKFFDGAQQAKFTTGIATGLVTGRINFFPSEPTRLYIPVGFGVGHMFAKEKFDDGSHNTEHSTSWAAMLGLGLEFDIDETVIFGVEGRYNLINLQNGFGDAIGKSRYHYMTVMLKLGCRF